MRTGLWLRAGWMRGCVCGLAIAAAGTGVAGAQTVEGATAAVARDPLLRPVTARFEGASLRDALRLVEQAAGVRVRAMWSDAEHEAGLDPERPVSLDVRCVSALAAVQRLLEQADTGAGGGATWQVGEDGAIEIGPRSRLNSRKVMRVYDIRDLVRQTPDFTEAPVIDLAAALRPDSGAIFRGGDEEGRFRDPDLRPSEDLMELIMVTVEPDQWVLNGGNAATMRLYQGQLVVQAPPYVHRQVAGWGR